MPEAIRRRSDLPPCCVALCPQRCNGTEQGCLLAVFVPGIVTFSVAPDAEMPDRVDGFAFNSGEMLSGIFDGIIDEAKTRGGAVFRFV